MYMYNYVDADTGYVMEHIQTCAPHENAFSILRINFRIRQSFSVVFLVAPPIAEIGLKKKKKKKKKKVAPPTAINGK